MAGFTAEEAGKGYTEIAPGVHALLKDGVPHCADGRPAMIVRGADRRSFTHVYYLEGEKSRPDGPAVQHFGSTQGAKDVRGLRPPESVRSTDEWWDKGEMSGPTLRAYITKEVPGWTGSGVIPDWVTLTWGPRGVLHCEDGPAVVGRNKAGDVVIEMYFNDGTLDRADGPAVVYRGVHAGIQPEWWRGGRQVVPNHAMLLKHAEGVIAKLTAIARSPVSPGKDEIED
jgi:hypothetical protein